MILIVNKCDCRCSDMDLIVPLYNKRIFTLCARVRSHGDRYYLILKGSFIAAFGSTNLGDVSPNTNGAKCLDTGLPCDFVASSCNNRVQLCIAFGPGKDMVDSTRIIGEKQLEKARVSLYFNKYMSVTINCILPFFSTGNVRPRRRQARNT